ncbi:hypothetical protein DFQ27_000766, partial [Actinomortierella ambigua]
TCTSNLSKCTADNTTCTTNLTKATSDLTQCTASMANCTTMLTACGNQLSALNATLAACNSTASRWGKARITPLLNSAACMTANSDGTLSMSTCSMAANQVFWYDLYGTVTPKAIIDSSTGKCLSLSQQKFVTCNGSKDQSWTYSSLAGIRQIQIQSDADTSKCLTQPLLGGILHLVSSSESYLSMVIAYSAKVVNVSSHSV